MKKLILIIFLVVFFFFGFIYLEELQRGGPDLEREIVFNLINSQRGVHGLAYLEEDDLLHKAALDKAKDMIERDYFSHDDLEGRRIGDILEEMGYLYLYSGENLAKGNFRTEADVVEGWMNSPGHRENILDPVYKETGVAIIKGELDLQEVWVAVQVFATPADTCPGPDTTLRERIEEKQISLEEISREIERVNRQSAQYILLIEENNRITKEINQLIESYNRQIEEQRNCLEELSF